MRVMSEMSFMEIEEEPFRQEVLRYICVNYCTALFCSFFSLASLIFDSLLIISFDHLF